MFSSPIFTREGVKVKFDIFVNIIPSQKPHCGFGNNQHKSNIYSNVWKNYLQLSVNKPSKQWHSIDTAESI